jgi:RecG-like helicase
MKYIVLIVVSLIPFISKSQSVASDDGVLYLYPNNSEDAKYSNRRGSYVALHPLGAEVTQEMNKFEYEYVYYVKSTGAYAVEEKIILKKPIYSAVKKVEKYYLYKTSKKEFTQQQSEKEFSEILVKAIKLAKYQTIKVETDLKKIKNPEDIINYMNEKIKFKE